MGKHFELVRSFFAQRKTSATKRSLLRLERASGRHLSQLFIRDLDEFENEEVPAGRNVQIGR